MRYVNGIHGIHYAWIIMVVTFLAVLLAAGVRSTFGVFLNPLENEFRVSRADVALVASLSILVNGASQPIIGHLLDRYGIRSVAVVSLALAAAGMFASSQVTGLWQMYITFGIVVSAGVGGPGTTMATVVAARWFAKHRGVAVGIMSAGNSAGQVALIPLAMLLNLAYGWRLSHIFLGLALAVLVIPIGLLMRSNPSDVNSEPLGASELSARARAEALEEARKTPVLRAMKTHGFWMLSIGYFVCGYSGTGQVTTHLVAYTVGRGIDPRIAATALGVIGGVSFLGTIVVGMITDRGGRKNPLAAVYFIRGVALLFLIFADDPIKLYMFAVIFGLGHFATVPPTAALTAQLFGRLSVGVIFGVIFTIHQIGGALGAYIAGLLFDLTGAYYISILISAVFCFVAATASFSIREQPVRKPAAAMAQ